MTLAAIAYRPGLAPLVALALTFMAGPTQAAPPGAAALRDGAQSDQLAWTLLEQLTTEFGPRLAGSASEARARNWAAAELRALGFSNVHEEPFDIPLWRRGVETAEVVSPFPQPLVVAAIGNSAATPPGGITSEVVRMDGFAALVAANPDDLKGKIVFIDHAMRRTQDGSSYFDIFPVRLYGGLVASSKGAIGVIFRSIGTDEHRLAHDGVELPRFNGAQQPPHMEGLHLPSGDFPSVPAAALSNPDADQLNRMFARGKPIVLHLTLTPRDEGQGHSANLVAEIPGRDPEAGVILIGGHLDSWDQGTGATDDGAGVAMMTAAAKRIMDAGQPDRTIRLVWFGSEEPGVLGGRAYAARHAGEKIVMALESDTGADRVWKVSSRVPANDLARVDRLAGLLAPLGVERGDNQADIGPDISPLVAAGAPTLMLSQDMTRYFDFHHTADDTLDKVDIGQLQQNVAAWTATLAVWAYDSERTSAALGQANVTARQAPPR